MSKSHVTGWGPDSPRPAQIKEFFDQVASGRISKRRLQTFLNEKDTTESYLRYLDTRVITPVKGSVTFLDKNVFVTDYLSSNFIDFLNNKLAIPQDTVATEVEVYETVQFSDLGAIYCSFGDLQNLCFTQGQVRMFCEAHRDLLINKESGACTSFLLGALGRFYYIHVSVDGDELILRDFLFNQSNIELRVYKSHRIVVPKFV